MAAFGGSLPCKVEPQSVNSFMDCAENSFYGRMYTGGYSGLCSARVGIALRTCSEDVLCEMRRRKLSSGLGAVTG